MVKSCLPYSLLQGRKISEKIEKGEEERMQILSPIYQGACYSLTDVVLILPLHIKSQPTSNTGKIKTDFFFFFDSPRPQTYQSLAPVDFMGNQAGFKSIFVIMGFLKWGPA